MRRVERISITLALACVFSLLGAQFARAQVTETAPPGVTAKSYLVYDMEANEIIATYNPQRRQPVASLTKLMTSILAAERLRFDGRYVLTESEQKTFKVETMRADKMLEMMLIPSNNAICRVVARIVSGDEDKFADEMNRRAAELNMNDSCFCNASGLPGETQHSTMFDVLTLARVAMSYPAIRRAMSKPNVELGGSWYKGTLRDLYDRHPQLLGGKTGYTRAAGRCLVLNYQSRGREYILITFASKTGKHSFRDAELILSHYGLYTGSVGNWGIEDE